MAQQTVRQLRWRALQLRRLADSIERSPVLTLDRHADTTVWNGPRPDFCVRELRAHQARLLHDADDLRWEAHLLEQRAAEVESWTATHPGPLR